MTQASTIAAPQLVGASTVFVHLLQALDIPLLPAEFSEHYSYAYRLPRVVSGDRALAGAISYPWTSIRLCVN
jgi:hypothetical protein